MEYRNIIKKKPKTTFSEIAGIVKNESNTEMHPVIIRRTLKTIRYELRVARRKPWISKINKKEIVRVRY